MKYIKKYAGATVKILQQDGLIRGDKEISCLMCGEPTQFVDICSEGRFCGDACRDRFYEMKRKLRKEVPPVWEGLLLPGGRVGPQIGQSKTNDLSFCQIKPMSH